MVTTATSTRHDNFTVDYDGAQVRAHYRHLATVVTVHGSIDATNVDRVSEHARRFILAKEPIVLDLSNVDAFAADGLWLLRMLDEGCRAADIEWTVVASPAVDETLRDHGDGHQDESPFSKARSVEDALHSLAEMINERRQLLLPLLKKTA